jgi:hypothetical protein
MTLVSFARQPVVQLAGGDGSAAGLTLGLDLGPRTDVGLQLLIPLDELAFLAHRDDLVRRQPGRAPLTDSGQVHTAHRAPLRFRARVLWFTARLVRLGNQQPEAIHLSRTQGNDERSEEASA